MASTDFEPFVKKEHRLGSVKYGIRSKSKILRPYDRSYEVYSRHGRDTFTITGRSRRIGTVELGNEKFELVRRFGLPSLHYSLNKRKRWEIIENLDNYVCVDAENPDNPVEADQMLKAEREQFKEQAEQKEQDFAERRTTRVRPMFFVSKYVRTFTKDREMKAEKRRWQDAQWETPTEPDAPRARFVVKGRKGEARIKSVYPRSSNPRENPADMKDTEYLVALNSTPAKGTKNRAQRPFTLWEEKTSRAHKYRGLMDSR